MPSHSGSFWDSGRLGHGGRGETGPSCPRVPHLAPGQRAAPSPTYPQKGPSDVVSSRPALPPGKSYGTGIRKHWSPPQERCPALRAPLGCPSLLASCSRLRDLPDGSERTGDNLGVQKPSQGLPALSTVLHLSPTPKHTPQPQRLARPPPPPPPPPSLLPETPFLGLPVPPSRADLHPGSERESLGSSSASGMRLGAPRGLGRVLAAWHGTWCLLHTPNQQGAGKTRGVSPEGQKGRD